jgi:hypothetical protein
MMRKSSLLLACLIFCFCGFSQKKAELQITTDDKPSLHGFSYWQQIHVHSKDTSFTCRLHTARPDVLKGLKHGSYTVSISSVFHHSVSKKISVPKNTVAKFSLAPFYTKAPENVFLSEKLAIGDTLFILYSASDESEKEMLAVTKHKSGYTAIQYEGISNRVFQTMQINEASFDAVKKLEKEAKKANSPKAETAPFAEVYTLELKKEYGSYIIPGHWNGMNNLKAVLFLVEKK